MGKSRNLRRRPDADDAVVEPVDGGLAELIRDRD
ncbi:spermine synthase, partial [Streptomyces sp. NPDC059766]